MADTITVKAEAGSGFAPHPEGQYAIRCVDVLDMGEKVEQFGDHPAKLTRKIALVFRSEEVNETGQFYEVSREFTLSMNEKANLRKFLASWRGKSYTEAEAAEGVPLHKLEGACALASIEHKTSERTGRTRAEIAAIGPLPKQVTKPDTGTYERAEFWEKRKQEYREQAAKFRADAGAPSMNGGSFDAPPASLDDGEDDLPF